MKTTEQDQVIKAFRLAWPDLCKGASDQEVLTVADEYGFWPSEAREILGRFERGLPVRDEVKSRREKIREKIAARIHVDLETGCHIWQGPTSGESGRGRGYPRMNLDGQTVAVHKVNWTNEHGYIPGKKQLDHICNNRLCVNHEHLELVTHKKNCARREHRRKHKETKQHA